MNFTSNFCHPNMLFFLRRLRELTLQNKHGKKFSLAVTAGGWMRERKCAEAADKGLNA